MKKARHGERNRRQRTVPRLLVPSLTKGLLSLTGKHAHYVRNVLKLKAKQTLVLFDGTQNQAQATIQSLESDKVHVEIGKLQRVVCASGITVGLSLPKLQRADWAVEKLTELGVDSITWIHFSRTNHTKAKGRERLARWTRLAEAAGNQCGRGSVPEMVGPMLLAEFVQQEAMTKWYGSVHGIPIGACIQDFPSGNTHLVVGPEGGLTKEESLLLEAHGFRAVCFGSWVLRTETAAVVGAGILASCFQPKTPP